MTTETKKSMVQQTLEEPINLKAIEQLLPARYRPHVERFVRRAGLTFATSKNREKLAKCSKRSIVQAVCVAAEYGFALDDKFCYAIPYLNTTKDEDGKEQKVLEVQAMFDYKALVAVARRNHLIIDLWAQEVCEKDEFEFADENFKQTYRFKKASGPRGDIIGAYAVVAFPGGTFRFEHMDIHELRKVRKASKSQNSPAWQNWESRMYVKAVVKRALTWVQDDPTLGELVDYDNREFDMDRILEKPQTLEDLTNEINADARALEHHQQSRDFAEELRDQSEDEVALEARQ